MQKTRLLVSLFTFACFAFVLARPASAQPHTKSHRHNVNITTNDAALPDSCAERLNIYSDDYADTLHAEETRTFPNQPMKVTASRNGGIQVHTWDKTEISVKVCKAAAARSTAEAKALLDRITLKASGNTLAIEGPENVDDAHWSTVVLINAPAGATFDLSAYNGGIGVTRFSGNVTAETVNGGISLVESSGKLAVEARNGGITIKDCSGNVKANVQNGGLHIELGETWTGEGLEAHTRNGGLMVSVPKNIQSGVELSLSRHSGVSCRTEVCRQGQRSWEDDGSRTIRFGSGATLVRASTINGGTVIKERGRKMGRL